MPNAKCGTDRLDMRVFDQDTYWVDRFGAAHRLDDMDIYYLVNVVMHLREHCMYLFVGTLFHRALEIDGGLELGRTPVDAVRLPTGPEPLPNAKAWLDSTPLMRRLLKLLSEPQLDG